MVRTSSVIHTRTDASPGQSSAPCVGETMWQRPLYSPVSPATQLAEGLKPREALTPMGSVFPGENSLRCSQPWTMRYHGDLGNLDVERSAGRNTASPQRQTPAPLSRRIYPQASEEAWAVSGDARTSCGQCGALQAVWGCRPTHRTSGARRCSICQPRGLAPPQGRFENGTMFGTLTLCSSCSPTVTEAHARPSAQRTPGPLATRRFALPLQLRNWVAFISLRFTVYRVVMIVKMSDLSQGLPMCRGLCKRCTCADYFNHQNNAVRRAPIIRSPLPSPFGVVRGEVSLGEPTESSAGRSAGHPGLPPHATPTGPGVRLRGAEAEP